MFRMLLRSHRWGIIGCSIFSTFILVANIVGYGVVAPTPDARATFAFQIAPIAQQLSYLLPLPSHLETMGGYIEWRAYPVLAIVLSIWALVTAVGVVRGDEDRRLLDIWLSGGMSRMRWLALRTVAFATASAVCVVVSVLASLVSLAMSGETLPLRALLNESVALWLLVLAWFGLALLLGQFVPTRGSAGALTSTAWIALFFANSLARTNASLAWPARVSPFHLFDANRSLSGGSFALEAALVLLLVAVGATTFAVLIFQRRDLGAAILARRPAGRPPVHEPARSLLLHWPVMRRLWQSRGALLAWAIGASLLAALIASVARSAADLVAQNPVLSVLIESTGRDPAIQMLGVQWFGLAALALAVMAVLRTARWAEDDLRGRLEIELAQPTSRGALLAERLVELTAASALVAASSSLVLVLAARRYGIALDLPRVGAATALLLPLTLCFGTMGALLAAWRPRLAVGSLTAIVVGGYFLQALAPLLHWPVWVQKLSIFALYRAPLVDPVDWMGLSVMLALIATECLAANVAFRTRDIAR
jgi:ABC-2 type transport system permease protein